MSSKYTDEQKRVRPDVLLAALLDDIAVRLGRIEKILGQQSVEGRVYTYRLTVGTSQKRISFVRDLMRPAVSVEIHNDGEDDLYYAINTNVLNDVPLRKDDYISLNFNTPKINFITLKSSGNSVVRIIVGY